MVATATRQIARNAKGRALRPARPLISDHARGPHRHSNINQSDEELRASIVIREEDPGAFTVAIEGEGPREFPIHRAARVFAAGPAAHQRHADRRSHGGTPWVR